MSESKQLRILAIGAHPDDCDIKAGGVALKYSQRGHHVRFVSMTNGDTGHYCIGGIELARRRRDEAQASARLAGIEYQIHDIPCGELVPTIENRWNLIREIREFRPDLIMTHRPNDYHPDHRYTSQLVQDASYLLTVPNAVTLTDHLPAMPVVVYFSDNFKRPYPFSPDVIVDIDDVVERKLDMIACHESQMYEWLPYNMGVLDQVPQDKDERRRWLGRQRIVSSQEVASKHRELLAKLYGKQRSQQTENAEAFEICEYGARLSTEQIPMLFPFFE